MLLLEMVMPEQPKTLQQVIRYYSDPEICIQTVAAARWPNGVTCPACEGKDHYYLKTRRIWSAGLRKASQWPAHRRYPAGRIRAHEKSGNSLLQAISALG